MKHFWALPALLRPALVLGSQHAFSVNDDLLAFPQYEVHFSENYLSEDQAQTILKNNGHSDINADSQVEHYASPPGDESHQKVEETEDEKLEYEMMLHHKQRYLCSIPQVEKPSAQPKENDTLTKAEQEKELARANDRGWELLAGMHGNCIYYMSGWWSYRFCYNQDVKQFHQLSPSRGMPPYPPVEDPNTQAYMLGRYSEAKARRNEERHSEEKWEGEGALEVSEHAVRKTGGHGELVTRGESRYLVQKMEGGTECDLTGRERKIEVQYHCNPSIGADRISLIKETSTCAYLMVIQTPRLCNDVAFQPPQKDAANSIMCRPVLKPEEAETYKHNQEALKTAVDSAVKEAQIWEADPAAAAAFGMEHLLGEEELQIVGDIIIGGHDIVPRGLKIEKSFIGGGKAKYVGTVASSWGKKMSKDELDRLGLTDLENLEDLQKRLQKAAGEDNWKITVVDTPRGREYRGEYGKDVVEESDSEVRERKARKGSGEQERPQQPKGDGKNGGDHEEQGSEEEYYKDEL
ncbi:hypothetical protein Q7P37_009511 [Cladosporium fusiforme]